MIKTSSDLERKGYTQMILFLTKKFGELRK